MRWLQVVSIGVEVVVAVVGVLIAVNRRRTYGWGIALTFAIYVIYDVCRLLALHISEQILYPLFFIASLSILIAVLMIYRKSD